MSAICSVWWRRWLREFIIIGVRGNLPLGTGYQYYDLKGLGNPIREMFDQAVSDLEAFIHYATQQYPVDPDRRYLLGFSQGAILSMTLALTMGEQLKGIVALNGYIPDFVKMEYKLRSLKKTCLSSLRMVNTIQCSRSALAMRLPLILRGKPNGWPSDSIRPTMA
ncbi:alpha/beta hydrolase [Paenibacillus rhizoplanae]